MGDWRTQAHIIQTKAIEFLGQNARMEGGGLCNYTLFTGGKFDLKDAGVSQFFAALAEDYRAGTMPAINEIRSQKFPFYVDIDLEIPSERIEGHVIRSIAAICNRQIQRFFVDADPFRCIVCTKSRGAVPGKKEGQWKHGIHLHWPKLIVLIEQALQMRASLILALDAQSWDESFGVTRPPWEEIVDEQVYRASCGGLRMLGAPKARRCTVCTSSTPSCNTCGKKNQRYIVDDNVYQLFAIMLLDRDDTSDGAENLKRNPAALLMQTSVRRTEDVMLTPGFRPYEGCPVVENVDLSRRKRKSDGLLRDDAKRLGTKFKKEVTDPEVVRIVRGHLVRHSEHYKESRLTIRSDEKSIRVALSGEGARYCANKADFHRSQHVYMEIYKCGSNLHYASRMRCFCQKPIVRRSGSCKDFKGPPIDVSSADVSKLFVVRNTGGSTCPLAQQRAIASQLRDQYERIAARRRNEK